MMKSISGLIESAKTVYDFKDAIWEDSGVDCDRCDYEMQVLYVQNRLYLVTCPCDVVHVVQARSPKDAIRKVNLGRTKMNEFDELKQQCMKIAKQFNREANELLVQAEELIESVRFIDHIILSGNITEMENIVKIHGEVTRLAIQNEEVER